MEFNDIALKSKLKHGVNILITAASRRVALIQAFQNSLQRLGLRGRVVTTDNNPLSPGLYVSDKHFIAPLTTHPDYIPLIRSLCARENISLVVPTIDDELPIFGMRIREFRKLGIWVLSSDAEVGNVCNDKYRTFQFLRKHGIPTAETMLPTELAWERLRYPLFLKPRCGRGSVGAYAIQNAQELRFFLGYVRDPIVQEYLHGREFTLDVLADFKGKVLSVVPRERLWVRAGVIDRGRTLRHWKLISTGKRVAEALGIRGPANIQCKLHNQSIKIIEINPRFSGGMPLTIAAGADFPTWIIQMMLGTEIEPRIGSFTSRLTMMCYESSLFLDGNRQLVSVNRRLKERQDSFHLYASKTNAMYRRAAVSGALHRGIHP